MKKLFLTGIAILGSALVQAQEQTAKGKFLIEANTGFGNGVGSTAFYLNSQDGGTSYNIGVEGGYFVIDNLALKAGLGYGGFSPKEGDASSNIGYKIGAKYYVINTVPLELSYNGISRGSKSGNEKDPSYIGFQGGYAVFLGENVSLEPGLRYNYSLLSKDDGGESNLQFNIGFALYF
jgi:hypothetical protein